MFELRHGGILKPSTPFVNKQVSTQTRKSGKQSAAKTLCGKRIHVPIQTRACFFLMSDQQKYTKPAARGHLLKALGLGFGLAVIVGNTIASGILRTPGDIARQLPSPWLFLGVWVVGGAYAFLGAISLAELGNRVPRSGGQYVFAHYALGDYAGFIVGWSDWLSTCGSTAAVALVVGEFAGALVPALAGRTISVALAVTILFAAIQWHGVTWGSWVQNITSVLKLLIFVALIVACFVLGPGSMSNEYPTAVSAVHGWPLLGAAIIALQSVIYTYDGWSGVIYFSEEVDRPERNIVRSLFGGIAIITVIYLLINVALLYVLGIPGIIGQDFALGAAARSIFGAAGDTIFRVVTIVSLLSGINAFHLMASRVLFAMGRDRLVTKAAVQVNPGGTPTTALFLSTVAAVLFIGFGQTFTVVISMLAFFFIANYTLSFISLIVLRRREPDAKPAFRAWGFPVTTLISLIGSVVFLAGAVYADRRNSAYALILLAVSFPLFLLQKWISHRPVRLS